MSDLDLNINFDNLDEEGAKPQEGTANPPTTPQPQAPAPAPTPQEIYGPYSAAVASRLEEVRRTIAELEARQKLLAEAGVAPPPEVERQLQELSARKAALEVQLEDARLRDAQASVPRIAERLARDYPEHIAKRLKPVLEAVLNRLAAQDPRLLANEDALQGARNYALGQLLEGQVKRAVQGAPVQSASAPTPSQTKEEEIPDVARLFGIKPETWKQFYADHNPFSKDELDL